MTKAEIQEFLDVEKWHESQLKGVDMCGRYQRCRYCDRFVEYPCATARENYEKASAENPEEIATWLTAEPELPTKKAQKFRVRRQQNGVAKYATVVVK